MVNWQPRNPVNHRQQFDLELQLRVRFKLADLQLEQGFSATLI